jgi:ribonuclease PH
MPKRPFNTLRPLSVTPHFITHPEGSVLITCGDTRVICTASVEEKVAPWLVGKGKGWITAEYDMLPRATHTRNQRDSVKGKLNGRTQEISRLIGRSLRSVLNLNALGERTITVDCDVIQADGGTRTTSITGGFIALALAVQHLESKGKIPAGVLKNHVAAISVGLLDGEPVLDLDYAMDSRAQVDMNVVMLDTGDFVEIQGTGENTSFSKKQMDAMLGLATDALPLLVNLQKQALAIPFSAQPQTVNTCTSSD